MKFNHIFFLIPLSILLCLYSCVSKQPVTPGEGHPGITFRSDRYLVCTLTQDATSSQLAGNFLGDQSKAWIIEDENPDVSYRAGETLIIPLQMENKAGVYENGYQTVPILCYHRFSKKCDSQLCMPEKVFAEQMKYLKENQYRVISMSMLLNYLRYQQALPKKAVVITIDDGYKSVYEMAYPILKQYGFTATLYIYTDFVGVGTALTWDQLKELKNAGFEIGSHTVSHADLTLKKNGENEAEYVQRITHEIVDSKKIIDERLEQDTILFAFTFGKSNQQIVNLCKQAGYQAAVTVKKGTNPFFNHPFLLHRNQVLSRKQNKFVDHLATVHTIHPGDTTND